ncbi:Trafficking protein particle complex subunit 8 [Hypsibius exemplaris]|uniref:Trafficking protein particle complex subunit 8 n=1 Tax=Hypsibius exemplaris TaxID=2072580 RepID=A0A1W0WCT2_HYPEX|nr:Trafficking protein particle complex subunit 8 [Hypsibius exemplaris]
MAQSPISPKEVVQDCFPPRIACLWSEDAEEICRKNNLSVLQLLLPFCRPNAEMISSDLTNRRFYMKNFSLHLSTVEHAVPPNPTIARNLFHDAVAEAVDTFKPEEAAQLEVPLRDGTLIVSATTPWFDAFRDEYMRHFPICDYECIRDFLGCIFVVSTAVLDPITKAKALIEQQVQQQANQKYPRWFGPNILKFFIVLEDLSASTDESRVRGESAMHYFTSTYGEHNCWLLKINSRSPKDELDPWTTFTPFSRRRAGKVEADDAIVENGGDEGDGQGDGAVDDGPADHPLATRKSSQKSPSKVTEVVEIGKLLGQEDGERIRECLVAFTTKCLIPYAERQIRILNELIISKKGIHRTLVNATKKIFGPSGPPKPAQRASSTSNLSQVVYAGEAVELQNRKAGDLSFMFQLYDQAFQFFQSARRDYSADQAWNYYAAASEMCGLSAFLSPTAGFSSVNAKGFPIQYFEAAIKSYSDVSKTSPQSVRAIILATEVCKALHLYAEAAAFFKNRSPEDFDLLYGLFLEQAGHCFLRLPQAQSPRRFAFQMIFAGFRYFKAAQRKLGIFVYQLALKVLDGRGWIVAEDHIRLNIIRHCMTLRMFQESMPHFVSLLTGAQRQVPTQQVLILRDFIACHSILCGDEPVQQLCLPVIKMQNIRTVLGRPGEVDSHVVEVIDEEWLNLEEKMLETKGRSSHVFRHQQIVYSDRTDNRNRPQASVGDTVTIEVPMRNPIGVAILISSVRLEYEFHSKPAHTPPADGRASLEITGDPTELRLAPLETAPLTFVVHLGQSGALLITGMSYVLSVPPAESEAALRIPCRQKFAIQGARLNQSKQEKMSVLHGPDHRLDITVLPARGRLIAKWENFPRGVLSGQVVRLSLIVENQGGRPVDHLSIAASLPDVLVFLHSPKADNVVTLQIPSGSIEPGKKVTIIAVFVAPPVPGSYCLKTLLYYETAVSGDEKEKAAHRHQVWRMQHSFEVLPGLTIRGSLLPSVASRDEVIVNLQIAHVNEIQLQAIPLKLIEILSVNGHWRIDNLADQDSGDGAILTAEETFLTLLGRRVSEKLDDLSAFPVPAELDTSDMNFIKAARNLAGYISGNPAKPTRDPNAICLRLLWKVTLTSDGKPTNVYGLRFITFTVEQADAGGVACWDLRNPLLPQVVPDIAEILARPSNDPFTTSFLNLPVSAEETSNFDVIDWKVELPADEATLPRHLSVIVPLVVQLTCNVHVGSELADAADVLVSVELRTAVKCFPVGSRRQSVLLRQGAVTRLRFDYCFTASGTYNMAEFVFVKAVCSVIPELKVAKLQKPSDNQMLLRIG